MAHEDLREVDRTSRADSFTEGAQRANSAAQLLAVAQTLRGLIATSFPPPASQIRRAALAVEDAAQRLERLEAEVRDLERSNQSLWRAREKALLELEEVEAQRDRLEEERDEADRRVLELKGEHRGMDWAAVRLANRVQS